MKRNSMWASLIAILAVTAVAAVALALGASPRLGLDLQGGISATYTPVFDEGEEPDNLDEVLEQTIQVIRERVDSLGVAEPEIAQVGGEINVQLPGIADADRANAVIGRTARLAFHPVVSILPPGTPEYNETPSCIIAQEREDGTVTYAQNPERPRVADRVVCGAATMSFDDEADPDATATPTPADDEVGPTDEATPAGDEATESAAGTTDTTRLVAAQEDVSPAPSPSPPAEPTATDAPSPASTPTSEPTAPEQPTDFGDDLPADAPRPLKYVLDDPPAVDGDELTGSDIQDATPSLIGQGYGVLLEFDEDGAAAFQAATAQAACERDDPSDGRPGQIAIVLDDIVESAPSMEATVACGEGIGGNASISTGDETAAEDLALVLRAGALPVTLEPATFETVSPTLGSSSLRNGLIAGLVGLLLVAVYLVWFYRALGLIAIGGLLIFGVLVMGAISAMGEAGFALTLAGVAGIIVAIGITADSSIIFFERVRDEVAVGKTTRLAVSRGFTSAFRTNLAGNTVTLVAAVILYFLAVGPVRGFAFTLGLATLLDLVIMWSWTRAAVGLLAFRGRLAPSIRRRQAAEVPAAATAGGGAR